MLVVQPGVNPLPDVTAERSGTSSTDGEDCTGSLFALESHLRDFLAQNVNQVIKWKSHLEVIDVEYSTDVGFIDLLAKDASGELVIFEFKLDRGPDAALDQILRYMGWCRRIWQTEPKCMVLFLLLTSPTSAAMPPAWCPMSIYSNMSFSLLQSSSVCDSKGLSSRGRLQMWVFLGDFMASKFLGDACLSPRAKALLEARHQTRLRHRALTTDVRDQYFPHEFFSPRNRPSPPTA